MSTNLTQIEDEAAMMLLARIAEGESKAMEDFYRLFSRTIYAFVLRRLKNTVDSEEVVVETMYEVWRHAGRFAGRSRPRTWVLGIAQHKMLDKVRMSKANQCETLGEDENNIPSEDLNPYESLAQRQTSEFIRRCMEELPDDQRECIHLAFYEDLAIAEIAEIQGIPENTVKTRLFHARRKLKLILERQSRWQMN